MAKTDSLLAILWMLSSGEKITAKQISEKLEMNIRTVYRYIDTLSIKWCTYSFRRINNRLNLKPTYSIYNKYVHPSL